MAKFVQRFLPQCLVRQLREHVNDDRLASLLCDELGWFNRLVTRRHLAQCPLCELHRQNFEARFDDIFAGFQQGLKRKSPPVPPDDTDEFLKRVDLWLASYVPKRRWSFRLPMITWPDLSFMNPTLATGLVLTLGAIVCVLAWNQQRVPKISSNALLVRAERWDAAQLQNTGSVIYQAVKITTPQKALQRKIYRDSQGKRQMRQATLAADDAPLRASFATAGIDWDEPLSASSYQQWHDSQHVREDSITRVGRNLLMLTTVSAQGPVEEQSLVVREMDFHPIKRTIEFRDQGTVEIAELEFKILPWSAVDASVFEPLAGTTVAGIAEVPSRVIPFPAPTAVSAGQLDEAELSARLVLNQLHADTGEQIQVDRETQGVVVKGVVASDQRKQQLQAQLRMLPHVQPDLLSVQELERRPVESREATSTPQVVSETAQVSPLATYLLAHGRSSGSFGDLSHELLNTAVRVEKESRNIADLMDRFGAIRNDNDVTRASLSALIFSHRQRLLDALDKEQELLGKSGVEVRSQVSGPVTGSSATLVAAAERNLALCTELTVGRSTPSRDAQLIAADLSAAAEDVRARLHQTRLSALNPTSSSGSK